MENYIEELSILDHLEELRKRILICIAAIGLFTVGAFFYSDILIALIKQPLGKVTLVYLSPMEGFITQWKVAFFGGVVLASPVIFYQTLLFISPALYKREKILLFSMLPFMILLFLGGIYFSYQWILPTTLTYLMSFGGNEMQPLLSADKYFTFMLFTTAGIGLMFETPMILLLLSKFGIVSHAVLSKKRKYIYFMIVVITAMVTPTPDIVTLVAVGIPLILLFEISLILMYGYQKLITARGKNNAKDI